MSLRKNSLNGSIPPNLIPRLAVKPGGGGSGIGGGIIGQLPSNNTTTTVMYSKEYMDAMNVLSEETMAKACSLLLSTRDYEQDDDKKSNTEGGNTTKKCDKSDYDQLLDIYKKVQEAAKIILREEDNISDKKLTQQNLNGPPYIPNASLVGAGAASSVPIPRSSMAAIAAAAAAAAAAGTTGNTTTPVATPTLVNGRTGAKGFAKTMFPPSTASNSLARGRSARGLPPLQPSSSSVSTIISSTPVPSSKVGVMINNSNTGAGSAMKRLPSLKRESSESSVLSSDPSVPPLTISSSNNTGGMNPPQPKRLRSSKQQQQQQPPSATPISSFTRSLSPGASANNNLRPSRRASGTSSNMTLPNIPTMDDVDDDTNVDPPTKTRTTSEDTSMNDIAEGPPPPDALSFLAKLNK